jgi:hypothetical protein
MAGVALKGLPPVLRRHAADLLPWLFACLLSCASSIGQTLQRLSKGVCISLPIMHRQHLQLVRLSLTQWLEAHRLLSCTTWMAAGTCLPCQRPTGFCLGSFVLGLFVFPVAILRCCAGDWGLSWRCGHAHAAASCASTAQSRVSHVGLYAWRPCATR